MTNVAQQLLNNFGRMVSRDGGKLRLLEAQEGLVRVGYAPTLAEALDQVFGPGTGRVATVPGGDAATAPPPQAAPPERLGTPSATAAPPPAAAPSTPGNAPTTAAELRQALAELRVALDRLEKAVDAYETAGG